MAVTARTSPFQQQAPLDPTKNRISNDLRVSSEFLAIHNRGGSGDPQGNDPAYADPQVMHPYSAESDTASYLRVRQVGSQHLHAALLVMSVRTLTKFCGTFARESYTTNAATQSH